MLEINNLSLRFTQYYELMKRKNLEVISDLFLELKKGELAAIIGGSGSGKSLLADSIMGILPENAEVKGEMFFKNKKLDRQMIDQCRGREIALIPQNITSFDPLQKIKNQVYRSAVINKIPKNVFYKKFNALLEKYNLDKNTADMYPFELSGGMLRRLLFIIAVITGPDLIIADEPTTGIHSEAIRQMLDHFKEITDAGSSVLLITHDIREASRVVDKFIVFYGGQTVEIINKTDFIKGRVRHPYTKLLWQSLPENGFHSPPGRQPVSAEAGKKCIFLERCLKKKAVCQEAAPPFKIFGDERVRCYHA